MPDSLKPATRFDALIVTDTYSEETAPYRGQQIGDIARAQGRSPLDVMLDIVIADDLRTGLQRRPLRDTDAQWHALAEAWFDPRGVVGGSDAGAHVDALFAANYPLVMIAEARRRQLAPLEKVIQALSDVPARRFGLRGRGRIADGWRADLVLFDPAQAGSDTPCVVQDLPDGSPRLSAAAKGVHTVFVNGVPVITDQGTTGHLPGTVLRSGMDTETIEPRRASA